jgi:16S rRNA (guanine(966)-N(2))-methyltransferase RsmD
MGAEALCRGAAKVVGIEQNAQACRIITENWQKIAQSDQDYQILRGDLLKRLENIAGDQFDLIYFDPPYAAKLYDRVLAKIVDLELLSTEGELAVEYDPKLWQPQEISGLELLKIKNYGKTAIAFYQLSIEP